MISCVVLQAFSAEVTQVAIVKLFYLLHTRVVVVN